MAPRHGRMRLFSGPLSMFGAKAEIAALEKGLDFERVMVPFEEKYQAQASRGPPDQSQAAGAGPDPR